MKKLALALSLVLAGTVISAAPASADDRRCTGVIGPVFVDGDLIVPKGATCALRGARVDGNVLVRGNAGLVARGVRVGGNVQAENHSRVLVTYREGDDRIVRSRVAGDIQLDDGGRAVMRRTVVGGNIQLKDNGGLQVTRRNVVDGDVQAFSNTGGVRVYGNRVGGNLQCKSNDPAPVGANNVVEGDMEDQCRGF